MSKLDIPTLVMLLLPILIIQLGLVIYALVDLVRREQVRGPRWAWIVGLVVTAFAMPTGIIVAGFYLAWGRHAEQDYDTR
jgi:Zn-dependent protease with chaperone function